MSEGAASIRDVARMAGVSLATVSNVLTGRKKVSAELAARVKAAVEALNYRADPLASLLRSGDPRMVAVLVPDLDNPFFTAIVSAVERCAGKDNYEVIVASSCGEDSMERAKLKAILAWRPAGLIVIPSSDAFAGRDLLEASGTPYVMADRVAGAADADTVSIDNEETGAAGARHLMELGHRHILVAASSLRLENIRQRCAGAASALRAEGLDEPVVIELGLSTETGCRLLSEWFARSPAPTAVLALTNFTTLTVLMAAAERGLHIPEDLSLIGFDDYAWMRARNTPLTAIAQPVGEIARAAWEGLNRRIKGDRSPAAHVRLPCELHARASTARPGLKRARSRRPAEEAAAG